MPHNDKRSRLLDVAANEYCRSVIEELANRSNHIAKLSELASHIASTCPHIDDKEQATLRLHHGTLPKLTSVGIVEYDPRSKTVRYDPEPGVENLLRDLRNRELVDGQNIE